MFYQTNGPHGLPHDPFKSCIVPRPIGWISTVAKDGTINLAPFSFFNGVASDPPMVMFSINGRQSHGGDKDTLTNCIETREFVVNMATEALTDQMNASCAPVGPEVNEFELAGLTPDPSQLVTPPRVAESPVQMECAVHEVIDLPCTIENSRNAMVLGTVLGIHIADEALTDGLIDIERLRPLARLGYMDYAVVEKPFTLKRPKS